jgi:hypothetical protein
MAPKALRVFLLNVWIKGSGVCVSAIRASQNLLTQMEFIICNCDIYDNNTGKFLLSMKELYLNIDSNNLLIEFIKYERRR